MAGAVHELCAVPGRGDRLPRRGVHRLRRDPGPDRGAGRLLRVPQHRVVGGELNGRRPDRVGPGAVGAVAAGHGAADVHHDHIARGQHPAGRLMVRAGRVRPGGHDHEVHPGMTLGSDRLRDVRRDLLLGPPRSQPLRHRRMHPVDGCARLAQGRDLRGCLADAQPAQGRAGQPLPGGGQRLAEAQHHHRPHPVRASPVLGTGPSRPATSAYGSSVSSHGRMSRPRPPAGEAWAAGSSSRGTTRNGSPSAGHREAGQPLQLLGVVADQVAQVRAGRQQQSCQSGLAGRVGGQPQPVRRVEFSGGRRSLPEASVPTRCVRSTGIPARHGAILSWGKPWRRLLPIWEACCAPVGSALFPFGALSVPSRQEGP